MREKFNSFIKNLQKQITSRLCELENKNDFTTEKWFRKDGGGGITCVIENGLVFEKGGVNTSEVYGKLTKSAKNQLKTKFENFFACGISIIIHPKNPMAPIFHANLRYFELYDDDNNIVDKWFGGGLDLTPFYIFKDDCIHFHSVCKKICDNYNSTFYTTFKKKCDEYFWNHHRNEARGVGGLFFDYCRENSTMSIADWYSFVVEIGNALMDAYIPIIDKRKDLNFSHKNREWQKIRRGRYVEFNLVHDKGTLFGLRTNGRIESILISLPPKVKWVYNYNPKKNSEEEKLVKLLKEPVNWI